MNRNIPVLKPAKCLKAHNPKMKLKVMLVIYPVSYICLRLDHYQRTDVLGSGPTLKCQFDQCNAEYKQTDFILYLCREELQIS